MGKSTYELRAEVDEEQFIRALVAKYGGHFHGPHVEHLSMEKQAFYRMMREFRNAASGRHEKRLQFYLKNPSLYPGHPETVAITAGKLGT